MSASEQESQYNFSQGWASCARCQRANTFVAPAGAVSVVLTCRFCGHTGNLNLPVDHDDEPTPTPIPSPVFFVQCPECLRVHMPGWYHMPPERHPIHCQCGAFIWIDRIPPAPVAPIAGPTPGYEWNRETYDMEKKLPDISQPKHPSRAHRLDGMFGPVLRANLDWIACTNRSN